jgi:hypothetical protein
MVQIMSDQKDAFSENTPDEDKTSYNRLVWSYLAHRKFIGLLGMLLPLVL